MLYDKVLFDFVSLKVYQPQTDTASSYAREV